MDSSIENGCDYEIVLDEDLNQQYASTGISLDEVLETNQYWVLRVKDPAARNMFREIYTNQQSTKSSSSIWAEPGDFIRIRHPDGSQSNFRARVQRLGTFAEVWSEPSDVHKCLTQKRGEVSHLVTIDALVPISGSIPANECKRVVYGILPLISKLCLDEKPTNNLSRLRSSMKIDADKLRRADEFLFRIVKNVQSLMSGDMHKVEFRLTDDAPLHIPFSRKPATQLPFARGYGEEDRIKQHKVYDRNDFFLHDTLNLICAVNKKSPFTIFSQHMKRSDFTNKLSGGRAKQ